MTTEFDDQKDTNESLEDTVKEFIEKDELKESKKPDQDTLVLDWSSYLKNNEIIQKYRGQCNTVILDREVIKKEKHLDNDSTVSFGQYGPKDMANLFTAIPDERIEQGDEAARDWLEDIASAEHMHYSESTFDKALEREGSEWKQHLKHGDLKLQPAKLKVRQRRDDSDFALRAVSALSVGGVFTVPLWHSGFWLTLKRPSESALQDLEHRLITEKIRAARITSGRALANLTSFVKGVFLDFVVDHIYSTNLESRELVRSKILVPDINILAWEMAAVCWPNGWNYNRPVIGDPNEPRKIIKQRINVGAMNFTDNSAFNEKQRAHMAKRTEIVTEKEVDDYQKSMRTVTENMVCMIDNPEGESVYLRLKTPYADQLITMGTRWINDIARTYESTMSDIGTTTGTRDQKNDYIDRNIQSTILRMYDHYVDAVVIRNEDGEEEVNTSDMARDEVLNSMSSNKGLRDKFFNSVREYIDNSIVSIIAIPVYSEDETKEGLTLPRFPYLIPVDPIHLFFTLLVQTTNRIRVRTLEGR